MKWRIRLLMLCYLAVGTGVVLGEGPRLEASWNLDWLGSKEGWTDYGLDNLCGVRAVSVVLRDLQRPCDEQAILRAMPPGVYGNSMEQIVDYLRGLGLSVEAVRCKAGQVHEELRRREGHCWGIINLYGHWAVARRALDGGTLEIVDYPRRYFMPVSAIDSLWEGHAIVARERTVRSELLGQSKPMLVMEGMVALGAVLGLLHICRTWRQWTRRG